MSKYAAELTEFATQLTATIESAKLLPAELGAVKTRLTSRLTMELNFINSLIGLPTSVTTVSGLPPLTSIMGQPIERRAPIEAEDLEPTDMEREKFLRERDELYSQFIDLNNKQLYSKSTMPGGEAAIRAVAKKAGVDNYADATINNNFFKQIRDAISFANKLENDLQEAKARVEDETGG